MIALGSLIFSGLNWIWVALGSVLAGFVLLVWSYRGSNRGAIMGAALVLKLLGLLALGACLLEPLWSSQRARPGANFFALLADNSQSLQIKDRGASRNRGERLREILDPQRSPWQTRMEENFEVRRYLFGARLQAVKDFGELNFEGRSSAMGSALRALGERFRNRPLAGVLLLTDGNTTDLQSVPELPGLPPIYPVILGTSEPIRDLAVQPVHVSQTAFEDAPVSVQAEVSANDLNGEDVTAQLTDSAGKVVAEQTTRVRKSQDMLSFRFQFKPETAGLSFYRIGVRVKSELSPKGSHEKTSEATLANNGNVLVVDRGRGPYRILYVAGRPSWEYKFLSRAIQEDEQLQLVGLIRVARREPKFNFMGRAGETSNPLFRGFDNQAPEDVAQYDQPVLVRLNTRDEFELRGGFPRTPEELYSYHAVIVGDLEASFFPPDQATLLQKFVSERGGGFLMLGGTESFQQGNYQRTPIGDMLPVYLDRTDAPPLSGTLQFNLTREGWLQAWARLRDNENDEKARIQSMAPFLAMNNVRDVKPGASVIASVSDGNSNAYPALIVQRFGRGRTAALTVAGVWHWGFRDEEAHRDMDKYWRQLMRWLVTDVPNRVDLTAAPPGEEAEGGVSIQVRVRDPKFQPLDNAGVQVEIQPVLNEMSATNNKPLVLLAEPSVKEPGLYEVAYMPRHSGGYKATAYVTNSVGAEVGRASSGWSTDLAAEEFRSLTPNLGLLEAVARKTGGAVIPADKLDEFVRDLPKHQAPVMESWTSPLWHTPTVFGFALACFVAEWGIRRWKGFA